MKWDKRFHKLVMCSICDLTRVEPTDVNINSRTYGTDEYVSSAIIATLDTSSAYSVLEWCVTWKLLSQGD